MNFSTMRKAFTAHGLSVILEVIMTTIIMTIAVIDQSTLAIVTLIAGVLTIIVAPFNVSQGVEAICALAVRMRNWRKSKLETDKAESMAIIRPKIETTVPWLISIFCGCFVVFGGLYLHGEHKITIRAINDELEASNQVFSISQKWTNDVIQWSNRVASEAHWRPDALQWSNNAAQVCLELAHLKSHPEIPQSIRDSLSKPFATQEDLAKESIVGKTVCVLDIPTEKRFVPGVVSSLLGVIGKNFEDCDIVGPQVLALADIDIERCTIMGAIGGVSINDHLLENQGDFIFGVTPFRNCIFRHCRFWEIAFCGKPPVLNIIRENFKNP